MSVAAALVERAASASPLIVQDAMSELADADELQFREEIERYPDPLVDIPRFIDGKELVRKLAFSLHEAGISPAGEIVELGAGTCWLSAELARRPEVRRVRAVEFSERRIRSLAPVAIAHLGAQADKIERHVADFYAHGLEPGIADFVFTDAAFHHAADPARLVRVAWDLLRPGGCLVLFREPTIARLRRTRDHGEEGEHGDFEREYTSREYLELLSDGGFLPERYTASGGWTTPRARAILHPPLSWLNGTLFAEYTYVGRRPAIG
ncbi:class I SAM-dependent methyltransferase [Solirubrobacter ginsenosidimutans]|uniref:Class I SAM-dependent methyltransferase n=1 Tax=Solirubrobacter ginsenosidimutans TaxID=490573 RepID=A0A9X3MXU5_9ACTN|nr:class I SAM-dependent methyltransferase [Solirubrobacter ginsenosidimutans]MDA0164749.1 class I SAM-dependent methyltransferase [Solirubrobacter ginsenosidimutans]